MAEQKTDEPRRPFEIGTVRYASTRRRERLATAAGRPTDVPVQIDIADIVAHKTAVLGMTRKGKSNTNKVMAAMTHQYATEQRMKIGQLIFDPAGEYANVNVQDGTALAQIGDEHVVRYRLGATDAELRERPQPAIARAELLRRGVDRDRLGTHPRLRAAAEHLAVRAGVRQRRRRGPEQPRKPTTTTGCSHTPAARGRSRTRAS